MDAESQEDTVSKETSFCEISWDSPVDLDSAASLMVNLGKLKPPTSLTTVRDTVLCLLGGKLSRLRARLSW